MNYFTYRLLHFFFSSSTIFRSLFVSHFNRLFSSIVVDFIFIRFDSLSIYDYVEFFYVSFILSYIHSFALWPEVLFCFNSTSQFVILFLSIFYYTFVCLCGGSFNWITFALLANITHYLQLAVYFSPLQARIFIWLIKFAHIVFHLSCSHITVQCEKKNGLSNEMFDWMHSTRWLADSRCTAV